MAGNPAWARRHFAYPHRYDFHTFLLAIAAPSLSAFSFAHTMLSVTAGIGVFVSHIFT